MGKAHIKRFWKGLRFFFLIGAGLIMSLVAKAVEVQEIHSFPSIPEPDSVLVQDSSGAFYGTTSHGGNFDLGTIYRATTSGTIQTLVSFDKTNGSYPNSPMVLGPDGALYGTTMVGGSNNCGTVFRVTTNGNLTTLISFDNYKLGGFPRSGLVRGNDGTFYGTTSSGGRDYFDGGTVFQITTNGELTSLFSFFFQISWPNFPIGASPSALAMGNDGALYGVTLTGGAYNSGTIFRVTTNFTLTRLASFLDTDGRKTDASLTVGSNGMFYGSTVSYFSSTSISTLFQVDTNGALTTVASFTNEMAFNTGLAQTHDGILYGTASTYAPGTNYPMGAIMRWDTSNQSVTFIPTTNWDAYSPQAGLMLGQDGAVYGTMTGGGDHNYGAIVQVANNGGLTTVASFQYTNTTAPWASGFLEAGDGKIYGASDSGGSNNCGTLFFVRGDGTFKTLVYFDGENGAYPEGALVADDEGALYGTTVSGGAYNCGTAFKYMTNGILTTLVSFDYTNTGSPETGLTRGQDGSFYGMAIKGSPNDHAVFSISTNGDFNISASFTETNQAFLHSDLALGLDGAFYGTTYAAGIYNTGTVIRVTADGKFKTLASFDGTNGANPVNALTLDEDGAFYGTTLQGGISNRGTIFRVTTNGDLTSLVSFGATQLLGYPSLVLIPDDRGAFYGAAGELFRVTTNGVLTLLKPNFYVSGSGNLILSSDGWYYGISSIGPDGGGIYRMNPSVRMLPLTHASSTWDVHLNGIPGDSYHVLRATNLSGPWKTFTNLTTDTNGDGQYKDYQPPTDRAFYRVDAP